MTVFLIGWVAAIGAVVLCRWIPLLIGMPASVAIYFLARHAALTGYFE